MRRRVEVAMLDLSGEVGFRSVTLDSLLARSGVSAELFQAEFGDLATCFAAAYEVEAEDLCTATLAAAKQAGDRRAAIEAALTVVLQFAAARPRTARALVREVYVAGGAALAKHEEVLERLARAMDQECAAPAADLTVPRAPTFSVGAVEGVIAGHLERGEEGELPALTPELMDLIVTFFGDSEPL